MKVVCMLAVLVLMGCSPGRNGQNGVTGPQGNTGPQGPVGTPGAPGHDGSNPTPTTIVQLCPGVPSYPAAFIEDAICLQGQLYGVYSANGGFLTLLTQGAYTSLGIGSSCNFTVGANCSVTH